MEAAVWAVARWADTYLLPISAVSPAMEAAFGASGNGLNVLRVLMLVAVRLLGSQEWLGEVDLHRVVVLKLLVVLVRRRTLCEKIVFLEEWHQLAGRRNSLLTMLWEASSGSKSRMLKPR